MNATLVYSDGQILDAELERELCAYEEELRSLTPERGGVYSLTGHLMGGLSDIDYRCSDGAEMVEIECDTGYRHWVERDTVLLGTEVYGLAVSIED